MRSLASGVGSYYSIGTMIKELRSRGVPQAEDIGKSIADVSRWIENRKLVLSGCLTSAIFTCCCAAGAAVVAFNGGSNGAETKVPPTLIPTRPVTNTPAYFYPTQSSFPGYSTQTPPTEVLQVVGCDQIGQGGTAFGSYQELLGRGMPQNSPVTLYPADGVPRQFKPDELPDFVQPEDIVCYP